MSVNVEEFGQALRDREYEETVTTALQAAEDSGVPYVAVFINGTEYQGYPGTIDDLSKAIESELDRLKVDEQD